MSFLERAHFGAAIRKLLSLSAVVVILVVCGIYPGSGYALPQVTERTEATTQLQYALGKTDKRVRQVRALSYTTLALTVLILVIVTYTTLRRTSPAAAAQMRPREILGRWSRDESLARLRKRQRELARMVATLQDFADQTAATNHDMSALLSPVKVRLQSLDNLIEGQAVASSEVTES